MYCTFTCTHIQNAMDAPVVAKNLGASSQQQLTEPPLGIIDTIFMTSDADPNMFNITSVNQNERKSAEQDTLELLSGQAHVRVCDTTLDKIKSLEGEGIYLYVLVYWLGHT